VGNVTQAIAEANSPNPNDIAFIERNDTVENFLSWLDVMKLFKAHSVLEPIDISSRSVNYADAEQAIQVHKIKLAVASILYSVEMRNGF
jgi:hypothetical protein